jgi:hypothetical protein
MGEIAKARGVSGFTADVLDSNKPMLMVFHKSGLHVRSETEDGLRHLTLLFDAPDEEEKPRVRGG